MQLNQTKYSNYALCKEMLETSDVIRSFEENRTSVTDMAKGFSSSAQRVFLTGEGSSRIFPAKNAMAHALRKGFPFHVFSEGATQALEYDLTNTLVLGASNSGKTKELIRLFKKLQDQGHNQRMGLTAHEGTPLSDLSQSCHVLSCGDEQAVAATKSVVEQALFTMTTLNALAGQPDLNMTGLADAVHQCLTMSIPEDLINAAANASTLYFAGRNDGVAEELTLKTNEITRKKSDYLEGTYGVHGIEEVMVSDDVVILINPYESEEEKFDICLREGVGMKVFAISHRQTRFPTVIIPELAVWQPILELCTGWSLLVEIGLALGIDLDKPQRARKVGNEYTPA